LGLGWKSGAGYSVLDGLWSLAVAVAENTIVSNDPAILASMLEAEQENGYLRPPFDANFPPSARNRKFCCSDEDAR